MLGIDKLSNVFDKMKILRLPIKTEWFDMILSGVKAVEYRQMKVSIKRRLYYPDGTLKNWDAVELTAGYGHHHPRAVYELPKLEIGGTGRTEWGAVEGERYYCLHLGELKESHNLKPYQLGLKELRQLDRLGAGSEK